MLDDVRRRGRSDSTVTFGRTYRHAGTRSTGDLAPLINPSRHVRTQDYGASALSRANQEGHSLHLEVGCSAGYLLRHLEEAVFPAATILHGLT
jgi:hypothetical protein